MPLNFPSPGGTLWPISFLVKGWDVEQSNGKRQDVRKKSDDCIGITK